MPVQSMYRVQSRCKEGTDIAQLEGREDQDCQNLALLLILYTTFLVELGIEKLKDEVQNGEAAPEDENRLDFLLDVQFILNVPDLPEEEGQASDF